MSKKYEQKEGGEKEAREHGIAKVRSVSTPRINHNA
jgi:hypothetical protein